MGVGEREGELGADFSSLVVTRPIATLTSRKFDRQELTPGGEAATISQVSVKLQPGMWASFPQSDDLSG
jgi:hypothetical protein